MRYRGVDPGPLNMCYDFGVNLMTHSSFQGIRLNRRRTMQLHFGRRTEVRSSLGHHGFSSKQEPVAKSLSVCCLTENRRVSDPVTDNKVVITHKRRNYFWHLIKRASWRPQLISLIYSLVWQIGRCHAVIKMKWSSPCRCSAGNLHRWTCQFKRHSASTTSRSISGRFFWWSQCWKNSRVGCQRHEASSQKPWYHCTASVCHVHGGHVDMSPETNQQPI